MIFEYVQVLHRMEVYITRGAAGKESKAFVGRISDEKALEMATRLVSEGFIFSVDLNLWYSFDDL